VTQTAVKPGSGAVLASSRLRRIIFVSVIVSLVWVVGIAILVDLRGDALANRSTRAALENASLMAEANNRIIERRFDALRTIAVMLTELDSIGENALAFSLLSSGTDREDWDDLTDRREMRQLSTELEDTARQLNVDGIFLADETGYVFAASDWSEGLTHLTESFANSQHFQDAIATGAGEQFGVDTVTGQPRFFFSIRLAPGGHLQGVVIVSTSSERLVPLLKRSHEDVMLTDDLGVVIVSSQNDWMYRAIDQDAFTDISTVDLGLRYGRSTFLDLPEGIQAPTIGAMADHATARATNRGESYDSHVVVPVEGLDEIRHRNLVVTIGLIGFGVLLVIVVALALAQIAAIRERAVRDPLTGLFNRRYIDESLPGLIELDERGRLAGLALVAFDLDKFKGVNDTWGHDTGDRVLRRFAQVLVDCSRRTDLPCRLGGEEFVAFLIEENLDRVEIFAERVRVATEAIDDLAPIPAGRITTSIGIVMRRPGEGLDDMVKRADVLLYKAKDNGRNRIERQDNEPVAIPATDPAPEPANS